MRKSWYRMARRKAGGDDAEVSIAEIDLYDEIGSWGIRAKDFIRDLKGLGEVDEILLAIHSPGGDVFDGLAIYQALLSHPARVVARIDGLAASMASVVAMAADEILMAPTAMMMIHNPWSSAAGDADDLRKEADLLDKAKESLLAAYGRRAEREQAAAWMDEETWFSGQEALEAGLADGLLEERRMAARIRSEWLEPFNHVPSRMIEAAIEDWIIRHEEREVLNDTAGEHMTGAGDGSNKGGERRKWWEVLAGASKADVDRLRAQLEQAEEKIREMQEAVDAQGEKIEEQAATIEEQAAELEKAAAEKAAAVEAEKDAAAEAIEETEKSVEARACAKALEIAAAQGIPARDLPAAGEMEADRSNDPAAIKAQWLAMPDGREKSEFFKAHKSACMS